MIGVMGGRIIISGVNYVLRQWKIIKFIDCNKDIHVLLSWEWSIRF